MQCICKANIICSSNRCWQSIGQTMHNWRKLYRFLTSSEKKKKKWKMKQYNLLLLDGKASKWCAHTHHVPSPKSLSIEMYTHMCYVCVCEFLLCTFKKYWRHCMNETKPNKNVKENKRQQNKTKICNSCNIGRKHRYQDQNGNSDSSNSSISSINQPTKNHFKQHNWYALSTLIHRQMTFKHP